MCLAFKKASMECHGFGELNDAKTYEDYNYWDEINYDKEDNKKYCKSHLNLINKIHNRIMTYVRKLIDGNNCEGFPKVDLHFDHREYQSKDSRGNRYHVHAGFNTNIMSLSEQRKIICCNPNHIFVEEHGLTYSQLLQARLLYCYDEYEYIEKCLTEKSRHWYEFVKDRCKQRLGLDCELICRMPKRPIRKEDFSLLFIRFTLMKLMKF